MKKHPIRSRVFSVALLVAVGVLASACGGGGSDSGGGTPPPGPGPLVATFVAQNSSPGANSMNMAPATPTGGAAFTVLVQFTQTNDVFGAGFRVTFDSTKAQFIGESGTGSFLESSGATTFYNANLEGPGELKVAATIQDASMPAGVDVAGTQTLIALNFMALDVTTTPVAFNFTNVEIQICPTAGGVCTTPTLTNSGGMLMAAR